MLWFPVSRVTVRTLLVASVVFGGAFAQTSSVLDGYTPVALQPGSPAGSYALSGFDTVNLFSGRLNFALPLRQIGGRGEAGYTMMLKIQRLWEFKPGPTPTGGDDVVPEWWANQPPDYAPGFMEGRTAFELGSCTGGASGTTVNAAVSRITFFGPDGTETELHSTANGGKYLLNPGIHDGTCNTSKYSSRGQEFVSSDGSNLTFISSSPITDTSYYAGTGSSTFIVSGTLYLANGEQYTILGGYVTSIRDRNGNQASLTYENQGTIGQPQDPGPHRLLKVADSLNRTTSISYQSSCDMISFNGFNSAARTLQVCFDSMGNHFRDSTAHVQTITELFGGTQDPYLNDANLFNPRVPVSVILPNSASASYAFTYNPYGELAGIILPTGGSIQYDYAPAYNGDNLWGSWPSIAVVRRLTERREYVAGNTTARLRTTYSVPASTSSTPTVTVQDFDSSSGTSTLVRTVVHTFTGNVTGFATPAPWLYAPWNDGRENETDEQNASSTVLRKVQYQWDQQELQDGLLLSLPSVNPRITQRLTTLGSVTSSEIYCYDNTTTYNNRSDTYEYDYGKVTALALYTCSTPAPTGYSTIPSGWIRHTKVQFKTDTSYTANTVHLWQLPVQQTITDNQGTSSTTVFEYDNYTPDDKASSAQNHAALQDAAGIAQHDSSANTSFTYRGNITGTTIGGVSTWSQYDIAGNAVKRIDGNGNPTSITFDSTGNLYAFPMTITKAGLVITLGYDPNTGALQSVKDANQNTTTYDYTDLLDRLKSAALADGGSITFNYTDTANTDDSNPSYFVSITRAQNSCGASNDNTVEKRYYDSFGRPAQTVTTVPEGTVAVKPSYDALGRLASKSNPYFSTDSDTLKAYATTYSYDALGRVTAVTAPGNAAARINYGANDNTYRTTDAAGAVRKLTLDARGRISSIQENPDGADASGPTTTYTYDWGDHVLTVTQPDNKTGSTLVQTRTFTYDGVGRLQTASNPETGGVSYLYDGNGAVTQRRDALNTVGYSYDALGRIQSKSYNGNLAAWWCYDGSTAHSPVDCSKSVGSGANLKEHVTGAFTQASSTTYGAYDGMGRVAASSQTGTSNSYSFSYTYNLLGGIETEKYPSGRQVTTCYDSAGRPSKVLKVAAGSSAVYADAVKYAPQGVPWQIHLNNGLYEHWHFKTPQLQPTDIGLGTTNSGTYDNPAPASTASDWSAWKVNYDFGLADYSRDNGNVQGQTITAKGNSFSQSYSYDPYNRLHYAAESGGWHQTFTYDRWGNRAGDNEPFGAAPHAVDGATNHLSDGTYSVGNLTVLGAWTYGYDADNRMVSATVNGGSQQYTYDAAGRRVKKVTLAGVTTEYVYDAFGALAAEYSTAANTSSCGATCYLTTDMLGSTRVVSDPSGNASLHDYAPFGEDLSAYRPAGWATSDAVNQKFTGKERDSETFASAMPNGLDYFGARYYSGDQGRFTSPDPLLSSGRPWDPQSWNRYAYVLNNPLRYTDPIGLYVWDSSLGGDTSDDDVRKNYGKKQANQIIGRRTDIRNALAAGAKINDPSVQAAIAAYGAEGNANGVAVATGKLDGTTAAQVGPGNPPLLSSADGQSITANVVVTFDFSKVNGANDLVVNAAHEGQHIADRQAFAAGALNPNVFDGPLNLTKYQTEVNAYTTGAAAFRALNPNAGYAVGGQLLWNPGWAAVDRQALDKMLAVPKPKGSYGVTPQNPGSVLYPK